jgi:hypothetical protein
MIKPRELEMDMGRDYWYGVIAAQSVLPPGELAATQLNSTVRRHSHRGWAHDPAI